VWESSVGKEPRLGGEDGKLLLGSELLADWRRRTATGTARVRAYYDVIPDRESALTLDPARRTPWGDPLPVLAMRDAPESAAGRGPSEDRIRALFADMARAGGGTVLSARSDPFQDHPGGGCRMGTDPATSVTDAWGRTHDHPNLFVVGAPTVVSGGCANGTLTFCALSLRSAAESGKELPPRPS
jgi:quinoprotein glucose dehydrogenase